MQISDGLKNLVLLKYIIINLNRSLEIMVKFLNNFLYSCPAITDLAVESLAKGLQNSKSLKEITLHFYECSKVTDSGLVALGDCFKFWTSSLQHVLLDLSL